MWQNHELYSVVRNIVIVAMLVGFVALYSRFRTIERNVRSQPAENDIYGNMIGFFQTNSSISDFEKQFGVPLVKTTIETNNILSLYHFDLGTKSFTELSKMTNMHIGGATVNTSNGIIFKISPVQTQWR